MQVDISPFWLSLKVAIISTTIVFFTGLLIARFLSRRTFYGKSILESILMLPLVLPPTVVGFGLLFIFGNNGWIGKWLALFDLQVVFTWVAAVIASVVVSFPLMYQSAVAAFTGVDQRLEQVARTMGASEWKVFRTITLPLAWPGLLAGLVLTFARGLGEFGATLMIAGYIPGKTDTLPLAIYFAVESGEMAKAGFWVLILVALGFSTMMWLNWWHKRTAKRYASHK